MGREWRYRLIANLLDPLQEEIGAVFTDGGRLPLEL